MKKGVILIHGLTGTPTVMGSLAESLGKLGLRVITPLLPGHGTTIKDLATVSCQDWLNKIYSAYDGLMAEMDEIFCAGLSLGALLTLDLALDKKRPLKRIACLGTPLKFSTMLERFILPLSHMPLVRQIVRYSKKDCGKSVADKVGREIYKNASYPKIPLHSVWELQRLQREVIKKLPTLNVPTLLIHSQNDSIAQPFNVDLFCRLATRIRPEIVWLEKSSHVITLDIEKEIAAKEVVSFFS